MGNHLKEPQYLKQQFKYCKNISWDEVIDAISKGYSTQSLTFLMSHQLDEIPFQDGGFAYGFCDGNLSSSQKVSPPTFGLHLTDDFSSNLKRISLKVHRRWNTGIGAMHIFTSLGGSATTYKKHNDPMDVLLVQAIGKMKNYVDKMGPIDFNPGDGLLLPAGTNHTPYVVEPRVTLSFAW